MALMKATFINIGTDRNLQNDVNLVSLHIQPQIQNDS